MQKWLQTRVSLSAETRSSFPRIRKRLVFRWKSKQAESGELKVESRKLRAES